MKSGYCQVLSRQVGQDVHDISVRTLLGCCSPIKLEEKLILTPSLMQVQVGVIWIMVFAGICRYLQYLAADGRRAANAAEIVGLAAVGDYRILRSILQP